MPRAVWSGAISFGLVSIPVQMFGATESKDIRFHFLDRRDMSSIGYDKINKSTGKHVDAEHIIRGFEYEPGRFVELTDEDVDHLDVELTHTIDICDFVSIDEIDPIYFRKAYYLKPQEGATKPYELLVAALEETGRIAIARVVIRDKQYLASIRPFERSLVLETMYYQDEVRKPDAPPATAPRKAEIALAKSLVEQLSGTWEPGKYHDRYRNELLELLDAKAKGEPLPEPDSEDPKKPGDLMDALRASVRATKTKPAAKRKPSARKPAKSSAAPAKSKRAGRPARS